MVHESMKNTAAKLCKIEKRGIGPSTLWAAIGIGLTLKDAAKKAYDAFEEKAKRRMEEKTTAIPLVQSSQPPPPLAKKVSTLVFSGRMARPSKPRDGSELKINTKTSTASSKRRRKPPVTTARPLCATDRSNLHLAPLFAVISVSIASLQRVHNGAKLWPLSDVFQTHHQEEFEENVLLVIDT